MKTMNGMMWLQAKGCGQSVMLEESRNWFYPDRPPPPGESKALPTP